MIWKTYKRSKKKKKDGIDYKAKLDRVFSKFIRTRDSKDAGYFQCISCGEYKSLRQADCGHFYSRRFLSLRWDEKNCHTQCSHCNTFMEGNRQGFERGLIRKHGKEVLEYLESKKNNKVKMDKFIYITLVKEYEKKLKDLCK